MTEIYGRIEELCRLHSVTITQLCRDCAIPRASLSDYKNGRIKSLSAKTLSKIADYFGVGVDFLYAGEYVKADEQSIKVSLFGGDTHVTTEMWEEVKRYAQYIKDRENGNQ